MRHSVYILEQLAEWLVSAPATFAGDSFIKTIFILHRGARVPSMRTCGHGRVLRSLSWLFTIVYVTFAWAAPRGNDVPSKTLTVAAAADLSFALPRITGAFERLTGGTVRVVYGSSGNLYAQIQNGAPFDVFLSADVNYARSLVTLHQAEADSFYRYAVGRLVLWAPQDSPLDLQQFGIRILDQPEVTRVAIANPDLAPYGRAALAVLQHYNLYDHVAPKLVRGENISQAAEFVQSGNAQIGILPLSLASAPVLRGGKSWEIPPQVYPPIEQAAVVLTFSRNQALARRFLAFLKTPEAAAVLRQFGYSVPKEKGR